MIEKTLAESCGNIVTGLCGTIFNALPNGHNPKMEEACLALMLQLAGGFYEHAEDALGIQTIQEIYSQFAAISRTEIMPYDTEKAYDTAGHILSSLEGSIAGQDSCRLTIKQMLRAYLESELNGLGLPSAQGKPKPAVLVMHVPPYICPN